MPEHHSSQIAFGAEALGIVLRIVSGIVTIGLLIVLPALKILGLA